jgi:ketosteroid isomerase-like protein
MSQENVEIARRGYEAFNKGDPDGMVANFAPNFEYVTTGGIPGVDAVYRSSGRIDGVRRMDVGRVRGAPH